MQTPKRLYHLLGNLEFVFDFFAIELSSAENKAYKEFSVVGGHEKENPQLELYIKAFGEMMFTISEQRGLMVRFNSLKPIHDHLTYPY